jgi:hypothetical protein
MRGKSKPDSTQDPIFSISLNLQQLWKIGAAIGSLIVLVVGGVFGLGVFVQNTVNGSAMLIKDGQLATLNTKNSDLERTVDALTKRLEGTLSEKDDLITKSEFLTRLVSYLQDSGVDGFSKTLLVNAVCSMWKESEKRKLKLEREPLRLTTGNTQYGLAPDIEDLLRARGVSENTLAILRAGDPSVVSNSDRARVEKPPNQAQRARAIDDVQKPAKDVVLIKIVHFSDGSSYPVPQEIATVVHSKSECAPI